MKFLGCMLQDDGGAADEIDWKYAKAVRAFHASKGRLCCTSTSIIARLKLLRTLVASVFLYGLETLPMPNHVCARLDALYM
eukprot:5353521-Karenia_brevis.AAC.1